MGRFALRDVRGIVDREGKKRVRCWSKEERERESMGG